MIFFYKELIALEIEESAQCKFDAYIKNNNFKVESGGILIGTLNHAVNKIIITDITEPQHKDRQSRFMFTRCEKGHQDIMDTLWENSHYTKTYLGEWHTHNEPSPTPSFVDKRNWIKISERDKNSQWLFFIIVGTCEIKVWTVSQGKIIALRKKES